VTAPSSGAARRAASRASAAGNRTSLIWEARVDGTHLHAILPGWRSPSSECCRVWSPYGRYYFFLSYVDQVRGANVWALRQSKRLFSNSSSEPMQLTAGPVQFGALAPSPDGKKLFAEGFQARGELVRYDLSSRQFVPFLRKFRRRPGFLHRRQMDRLRLLSRTHSLAKPRRWKRSPPAHFSADRCRNASLVLRCLAACLPGHGIRKRLEDPPSICGSWSTSGNVYRRFLSSGRSMVSGWPTLDCALQRFTQNSALRFQHWKLVRLDQCTGHP
jgi:hypothetical protein